MSAAGYAHRTRINHSAVTAQTRTEPGTWFQAGVYASTASADCAARSIPHAERMPNYAPAGAFEAYTALTPEGPALWVRCVEGEEFPAIPERMSVRVPDGGPELGEIQVITASVLPYCPRCGGPRGWDALQPFEMPLGDTTHVVDRWENPCGHLDVYADVLVEARRTPTPQAPAAGHGMGHHPADPLRAGEFHAAVEVIVQAASAQRGMHAKQAAALLRLRGHTEAADLVELKLRDERGHLSAKQAAHFLTVEGARRASAVPISQESTA
ncbi:hypothetical protein [Streptomyces sp. NPDC102437]|uniref:hypothetical protein n=1 Tax=Streptomyces sp. NPDC102437 TaxID=3366175 RepID=UPI0038122547